MRCGDVLNELSGGDCGSSCGSVWHRSAAQRSKSGLNERIRVGFSLGNIPVAKHCESIVSELQRQAVAQQRKTMR